MPFAYEDDEMTLHKREIESFIARYGVAIDPKHIQEIYDKRLTAYESAPIRTYIPIIVSREVEEALLEIKQTNHPLKDT